MTVVVILDHAAVLVFALTGAFVASRAQLDIIGFVFLSVLTGVGGGTVRDVILDRNPVFWLSDPTYLGVASAAALIVFFTAHLFESRYRVMLWLDAAALAFLPSLLAPELPKTLIRAFPSSSSWGWSRGAWVGLCAMWWPMRCRWC